MCQVESLENTIFCNKFSRMKKSETVIFICIPPRREYLKRKNNIKKRKKLHLTIEKICKKEYNYNILKIRQDKKNEVFLWIW